MLRMTLILCIGMYAALMIAGADRGQLRPGLAEAAARATQAGISDDLRDDSDPVVAAAPVIAEPVEPAGSAVAPVATAATPAAGDMAAVEESVVAEAAPYVEPARTVVTEVKEPVFSLASVGNEAVPSAPAAEETAAEVPDGGEGTIWYVNASSVNVRAEPSTEAEIVGRLASGEATLMVQAVDSGWARIVIQGDGVEGFVALRYLSAEAP